MSIEKGPREPEETPESKEEEPKPKTTEEIMAEIMKKDKEKFDAIERERQDSFRKKADLRMREHKEGIEQAKEEHRLAQEELKKSQEELKKKSEETEKLRKSLGF